MRHRLIILLIHSLLWSGLYAQEVPFFKKYDSVNYQKVQINGVPISGTKKDILRKIGKPQKITKYRNDSNDDHWFEYHYDRTILEVLDDGSFYGFKLRTRAFEWRYGADSVKVGDPVSVLCKYFPASCRTMKAEKAELVRVRCQATDAFIHFFTKNGIVTSIETFQEI
jgi:hypothetical protein